MRIVSLVPSSTETLLALGADVIACTRFCEQPDLAHVGGTKNPDVAAILALAPDLVVMDREENRIEDHDALSAAGLDVFVSDVTDVDSALAFVDEIAALVELPAPPVAVLPSAPAECTTTAFVPIWRRPWMTISSATYGASVLRCLGIDLAPIESSDAYPTVSPEEITGAQPSLIIVPTEPYEFNEDHVAELSGLVPSAEVVRVDGQDLFWWGQRTVEAVSRLAVALGRPATP